MRIAGAKTSTSPAARSVSRFPKRLRASHFGSFGNAGRLLPETRRAASSPLHLRGSCWKIWSAIANSPPHRAVLARATRPGPKPVAMSARVQQHFDKREGALAAQNNAPGRAHGLPTVRIRASIRATVLHIACTMPRRKLSAPWTRSTSAPRKRTSPDLVNSAHYKVDSREIAQTRTPCQTFGEAKRL